MAKYKSGDAFVIVLSEAKDSEWDGSPFYGIAHTDGGKISEKILDSLLRIDFADPALRTEVTDHVPAYRSWKELLQEPEDMTSREKVRLTQIKLIPETIRESISQREEELREEIKRLERELDQLCDFLNGEWDPAPEISSKKRGVSESSIEFK